MVHARLTESPAGATFPAMPEPTPFEKLQALTKRVLSVPKAEIDRREGEWRKEQDAKKHKRKKAA